jgi:hypothetical protein
VDKDYKWFKMEWCDDFVVGNYINVYLKVYGSKPVELCQNSYIKWDGKTLQENQYSVMETFATVIGKCDFFKCKILSGRAILIGVEKASVIGNCKKEDLFSTVEGGACLSISKTEDYDGK